MPNRVFVGMPCYGPIPPETLMSTVALLLSNVEIISEFSCLPYLYIDQARNNLSRSAIACGVEGASHLQFIDSDMLWPPSMIKQLLSHNLPVVGYNYFVKTSPHQSVAYNFEEEPAARSSLKSTIIDGRDIKTHRLEEWPPNSLVQVGGLGMGATLVHTDVLREMQKYYGDERWFRSEECGEDVWFFYRLKKMGIPVYLDTFASCGHMSAEIITEKNHYECKAKQYDTQYTEGGRL